MRVEIVIAPVFFFYLEKFWDRSQVLIRSLNYRASVTALYQKAVNKACLVHTIFLKV